VAAGLGRRRQSPRQRQLGLQIGGQAADYVFLVMNPKGIDYLMRSQFTLGGDAAVAAGPVGRTGSADTDLRMRAEILSYSRTRGLFAGLSLEGSVVKQDKDGNENVYGERVDPKRLLIEGAYPVPPAARGFVELLATSSPRRAGTEGSRSCGGRAAAAPLPGAPGTASARPARRRFLAAQGTHSDAGATGRRPSARPPTAAARR
jgi:hypothetical protein